MKLLPILALLSALWGGNSRAVVSWSVPAGVRVMCLSNQRTTIRCWAYPPAGGYAMRLGETGPMDALERPVGGETYTLWMDGEVQAARLQSRLFLPTFYL